MKRHHLYILLFLVVNFSCAKDNNRTTYVDPNEALLESLTEVDGYDHTYNYDFKFLQFREKATFFKPLRFSDALASIPAEMKEKFNLLTQSDLPFIVAQQQANIVTSWNAFNKLEFQIQFSYLENLTGYKTDFKNFFIVSITQHAEDPFLNMDEETRTKLNTDLTKRKYNSLDLTETHILYYLQKSENTFWPRMFDYYKFIEDENRIYKESTGSYQYYTWHNGLIYKIGFNMDISTTDHEALIRKIVLGN